MKNKLLFFIIYFPLISFSQGINNLWLLGYPGGGQFGGMNLDFSSGSLVIIEDTTRKMDFNQTNAEICNKNGRLLFYYDGVWISNALNDTMANGSGLNPSAFTTSFANIHNGLPLVQANLIIPFSSDSNR